MAPGFNALANDEFRVSRHGWRFAGEPVHHFGGAVVRGHRTAGVGCVQAKLLLFTIEVGRPVEAPLDGARLVVAGCEIDLVSASVLERPKVARTCVVNRNALMRLRRQVIGLALALPCLVCAGLVLLGELLGNHFTSPL